MRSTRFNGCENLSLLLFLWLINCLLFRIITSDRFSSFKLIFNSFRELWAPSGDRFSAGFFHLIEKRRVMGMFMLCVYIAHGKIASNLELKATTPILSNMYSRVFKSVYATQKHLHLFGFECLACFYVISQAFSGISWVALYIRLNQVEVHVIKKT